MKDYLYLMELIESGDLAALEEATEIVEGFPHGRDELTHSFWLSNAIARGPYSVVKWMLDKGVNVDFVELDGCAPLHSAIDRQKPEKYEIMRLLITAGADLNARGFNDWTPSHLAATRDDLESLRLLVEAGADLSIKTRIDDYATPLEEAKIAHNSPEIIEYLTEFESCPPNQIQ